MEFRVLGPLEAISGERSLPLGGPKQRALLAMLLIHANEVVPNDRLIDAVWGVTPPDGVANSLQVLVSKLRKSLTEDVGTPQSVVTSQGRGYRLRVLANHVDMIRFESLVDEAREDRLEGHFDRSAASLRAPPRLWRGPVLADFSYEPFAEATIQRLEELRASALEDRIESDLALGRHERLVPELEGLVAMYPLRERLRGHLMLALYRSSRQAEALAAYEETRRELRTELGIEPGKSLQSLHRDVLAQAHELDLAPSVEPEQRPAHADVRATEARGADTQEQETRKMVSIVFSDVVGSTTLSERLDPEILRRMLARYFDEMRVVLERHGGTVEKYIGDAVVAVFGLPRAHEDDALRAVRAAAEAREHLERLNQEFERDIGVRLLARTGVSTGEVVAGDTLGQQPMVSGMPVNLSARLEQAAEPGEILIDAQTHDLARDAIDADAAELIGLKGFDAGVRAYRVLRVAETGLGRDRPRPAFVGRKHESSLLGDNLERVAAEAGCRLVTVLGSAGVGKSRLVEEFLGGIAGTHLVFLGRCLPYGEGITFWPIAEIVRQACGIRESEPPDEVRARIEAVVNDDEHRRSVAERMAQLIGIVGAEAVAQETFWAIRRFLRSLAGRSPLTLVIDDLQWAEPTLLDLLEDLSARMMDAHVLLLCVARPELMEKRPGWGANDHASSIRLGPLDSDESREFLRILLGGTVASDVETRIVRATEGNPLFIEESVSRLVEEGALRRSDAGWVSATDPMTIPVAPSVQAVLAARLDTLSPPERAVIARASVMGEVFYWSAVAALSPEDLRPAIGGHLQALIAKQLIRPAGSDLAMEDAFRFRHILVRDVAYRTIPKATRAEFHERLAGWLEGAAGERMGEFEEILAFHLEQAYRFRADLGPPDDATRRLASRAVDILWSAGVRAFDRGDSRAAVALLDRALSLIRSGDPRRSRLLIDVQQPLCALAEFRRADEVSAEAIRQAKSSGDQGAEWRARLDRTDLDVFIHPDKTTSKDVLRVADKAIEVFESLHDDRDLVHAWITVSYSQEFLGQFKAAEGAAERALEHARRSGRPRDEAKALDSLVSALFFGPTPAEEAIERGRWTLDRIRELGAFMTGLFVLRDLALVEARSGRFATARKMIAECLAEADSMGDRDIAQAVWRKGDIEALAGNEELAESELRRAFRILMRSENKGLISSLAAELGRLVCSQNRVMDAEAWIERSEEATSADDIHPQVVCRSVRARIFAREGRLPEAETLAKEAVDLARQTDWLELQADAQSDLAEVLVMAGQRSGAIAQEHEALRLYELKGHVVGANRARRILEEMGSAADTN